MTQPVDTKELRLAGNDYMMTQPYATKYPQLVLDAADELDALCARVAELEAQLSKSEEWGKEMKRQANEQANLANTWMNRRLAMQDELARICYERDELRSGNDNLQQSRPRARRQ